MRVPPDTFRKNAGVGYYDVYEYVPGWRSLPMVMRRSVLLGRAQVTGKFSYRFFPEDGAWPQEFPRYSLAVDWAQGEYRAKHGEDWSALSVPVRAGDGSGARKPATTPVVSVTGLSAREYRALQRRLEEERLAAEAKAERARQRHERRMAEDPSYRANFLYEQFRRETAKSHALYYRDP